MLVQSIDRAVEILSVISVEKNGLRLLDVCKKVNLPKSTVHRLLESLIENGFIEKTDSSVYKAGSKIVELASIYLNNLELKTEAYPYIQKLANDFLKAAHLAILQDDEAVYIDKVSNINSMRMYSEIGKRVPFHCTGVGKILLSGLSDNQLKLLLSKLEMPKYTKNTITDAGTLYDVVKEAAVNGYAYDLEEHELAMNCVAAPVYDYRGVVIAAISLSGINRDALDKARDEVVLTAKDVSRKFGYFEKRI